jgi:hypothetical protein
MIRTGLSISDYDKLIDPVRKAREEKSGKQAGDPAKAAQVLLEMVEAENPQRIFCLAMTHSSWFGRSSKASAPKSRLGRT